MRNNYYYNLTNKLCLANTAYQQGSSNFPPNNTNQRKINKHCCYLHCKFCSQPHKPNKYCLKSNISHYTRPNKSSIANKGSNWSNNMFQPAQSQNCTLNKHLRCSKSKLNTQNSSLSINPQNSLVQILLCEKYPLLHAA